MIPESITNLLIGSGLGILDIAGLIGVGSLVNWSWRAFMHQRAVHRAVWQAYTRRRRDNTFEVGVEKVARWGASRHVIDGPMVIKHHPLCDLGTVEFSESMALAEERAHQLNDWEPK